MYTMYTYSVSVYACTEILTSVELSELLSNIVVKNESTSSMMPKKLKWLACHS